MDDLFTRTTVEMVALAAEDEVVQAQAADPARRRRRWLETGIAVAAAGLVGFVIIAITAPDENAGLLRDLSVVKNLELYRDVGNLELLKQFQNAKMFTDDNSAAPPGASAGWRQTSSTSSAQPISNPQFLLRWTAGAPGSRN